MTGRRSRQHNLPEDSPRLFREEWLVNSEESWRRVLRSLLRITARRRLWAALGTYLQYFRLLRPEPKAKKQ